MLGHITMIFLLLLLLSKGTSYLIGQIKDKAPLRHFSQISKFSQKEKGNATLMGLFCLQCFMVLGCPLLLTLEENQRRLEEELNSYQCLQAIFVNKQELSSLQGPKGPSFSSCLISHSKKNSKGSSWKKITIGKSKELSILIQASSMEIEGKGFWKGWCGSSLI